MRLGNITFDCHDPRRLAQFWAAVFRYPPGGSVLDAPDEIIPPLREAGLTDDDLASRGLAEDPNGDGPRFYFHRVPEGKRDEPRTERSALTCPNKVDLFGSRDGL